jgi:membrane-associated phospholipid phosphatase
LNAAAPAVAFVALVVAVGAGLTRSIDASSLDALQRAANPALDVVGSILTVLGQFEITAVVAVVLAAIAWRRGGLGGAAPLLLFAAVAIELVLKLAVPQPVPPSALGRDLGLIPGASVDTPFSFPSGHVLRTTFLAALVTPPRAPWVILAVVLVLAMAITRVYLAEHWSSDVVGGLLLGLALGLPARRPYFDAWRRVR